MERARAWVIAGAAICWSAGGAAAIERMTMPEFALTDTAGRSVSSRQLTRSGRSVVLYVGPDCPPCTAVLQSIDGGENPLLPSRLAIVMNSSRPEELAAAVQRFPALATAAWYADAGSGAKALSVAGVPAVIGVQDGVIAWSVAGVLTDATDLRTIIANWVR